MITNRYRNYSCGAPAPNDLWNMNGTVFSKNNQPAKQIVALGADNLS